MSNYEVFSTSYKTLGSTDEIKPEFKLYHNFALQTKPYTIPKIAKEFARNEVAKLLEAGIIESSSSNYSFPVIFVKKKSLPNDKSPRFRMVIDYRLLNSITESYKICIPKINDILQNIAGKKLYSVLDLKAAFFQIQLQDSDKEKLAFSTEFGNFQPTRLPFGLKNSTSYFHALISKCLDNLRGKNVQYFLDDIIIAADNMQEMQIWLQKVFQNLKEFNLTLDPAKLQLCQDNITYLGFNLNSNGYAPSEDNINKITNFPQPKNVKQVQAFCGMVNYFRNLIFNFAEITKPIVELTKKNVPFIWSTSCQEAFEKIQKILINKPTVRNIEDNREIYLVTDASRTAVCGILLQKENDKFFPIEFYSKQLNPAESRYPSIRRELYAIYLSVKHYHEYLYGRGFKILTDAKPLTFHMRLDKQPDIITRWLLYLQGFNYSIEHIPGFSNPADFLSRVTEDNQNLNLNALNIFASEITELNNENILKHQLEDKELTHLRNKILENDAGIESKYFIDTDTNLLMIKIKANSANNIQNYENKIVIPKILIKQCLIEAHKPHFGGHRTYELAKRQYFWKGMLQDAKNFCSQCHKCLQNRSKKLETRPTMITKSNLIPGQMLAIDVVGKLPRSHDGKFYILTIIDHYSRFLEAIPLMNVTSDSVIKALNDYFSRFGIPKILLSDNGTNFTSSSFENFLKSLNIEHRKASIYFPRSNGVIERIHRSLKESIASLSEQIIEWSDRLKFFILHYNNVKHAVTNFSPAQLFFGRNLNIPMDQIAPFQQAQEPSKYLKLQQQHIEAVRDLVAKNEAEYFNKNEKYLKGSKMRNYDTDDLVYLKSFNNPGTLRPKFSGPYTILKKLRNDNYIIRDTNDDSAREIKVHISKIFRKNGDNFCSIANN